MLELGDLHIDLEARRISRYGEEIRLTPNDWKLLKDVWGTARPSQGPCVSVYLHQPRQKLEENPANPQFLITEPWVEYRLVVDI